MCPSLGPALQGCYPDAEQGPWALGCSLGAWAGAVPGPEITQTRTLANAGSLEMDLFFLLGRLTFGISGCWLHARLLWPSACQLL